MRCVSQTYIAWPIDLPTETNISRLDALLAQFTEPVLTTSLRSHSWQCQDLPTSRAWRHRLLVTWAGVQCVLSPDDAILTSFNEWIASTIANKNLVTEAIEADLLAAEAKSQEQFNSFVLWSWWLLKQEKSGSGIVAKEQVSDVFFTHRQELRKQSKQTKTFCSVSSLPMKLGEMSISRMS